MNLKQQWALRRFSKLGKAIGQYVEGLRAGTHTVVTREVDVETTEGAVNVMTQATRIWETPEQMAADLEAINELLKNEGVQ